MKKEIHPKYEKTTIECACGNTIETKTTAGSVIKVELCSACHPFFTGKQKFVDTAGRVDKFRAKMEKAASLKSNSRQNSNQEEQNELKQEKDNKEVLEEIKDSLKENNPIEVTQEQSSDVEAAAADELADDMGEHQKDAE